MFGQHWNRVSKRDPRVVGLYSRHYSSQKNGKTIWDWLDHGITSPGEDITLLTSDCSALFVWLKQKYRRDEQSGVNCVVFRNEGSTLSSTLILEAEQRAWRKWPGERLYTFIDIEKVRSSNPGYCFQKAGWNKCGFTRRGLLILEKFPIFPPTGSPGSDNLFISLQACPGDAVIPCTTDGA